MPEAEQSNPTILIIERDRGVRTMLARLVTSWGYEALSAESEQAGLTLLDGAEAVDLVMSDFQPVASERTAYDYLTRRSASPAPPFLCTNPTPESPTEVASIRRPFDTRMLRAQLTRMLGSS